MLSQALLANSWTVVFFVRPVENEPVTLRPPAGPLWVSFADGQQDQAQMMMYKGYSSSSTSAVNGNPGALRMRDSQIVSTQDPRTQHWAAPPEDRVVNTIESFSLRMTHPVFPFSLFGK